MVFDAVHIYGSKPSTQPQVCELTFITMLVRLSNPPDISSRSHISHGTRRSRGTRVLLFKFCVDSLTLLLCLANAHFLSSAHAHDYILQDTWNAIPRHRSPSTSFNLSDLLLTMCKTPPLDPSARVLSGRKG
jgi:hypothetical protein